MFHFQILPHQSIYKLTLPLYNIIKVSTWSVQFFRGRDTLAKLQLQMIIMCYLKMSWILKLFLLQTSIEKSKYIYYISVFKDLSKYFATLTCTVWGCLGRLKWITLKRRGSLALSSSIRVEHCDKKLYIWFCPPNILFTLERIFYPHLSH